MLINIGCGAVRPPHPWVNVDNLHSVLLPGTNERANLDSEPNYIDHDISNGLPFADDQADGILLSHVIEHFDCMGAVGLLKECRRVLKPGGVVLVSVPNATYFREKYDEDTFERAVELFGEPIQPCDGEATFFGFALFYREHKQILTIDTLWCLLKRAGFVEANDLLYGMWQNGPKTINDKMWPLLNRRIFSLEMAAVKWNDS